MIDSHCHLHYDYLPKSAADLVREAEEAGVHTLISVGVDIESLQTIQTLSTEFPNVFHSVGIHPHDASKITTTALEELKTAALHPKCVAWGEIGLDYYYEHSDREVQKSALRTQLEIATELSLPIIVHSRDGENDLLPMLHEHASSANLGNRVGVIHCFTGTEAFARACIDLGYCVSFSGILTFKNSGELREIAKRLPLDRLLVETDSPT